VLPNCEAGRIPCSEAQPFVSGSGQAMEHTSPDSRVVIVDRAAFRNQFFRLIFVSSHLYACLTKR
jgi:hypothetical protein